MRKANLEELIFSTKKHAALNNPGALVIDMQEYFVNTVEYKRELLQSQSHLLAYCKKQDIPAVGIELKSFGPTIEPLRSQIDELPRHDWVTKPGSNAFDRTDLNEILREWRIDTLLLMGVYASLCVLATAGSALKYGFSIITADQLIADNYMGKTSKDVSWYEKNGIYYSDYQALLK